MAVLDDSSRREEVYVGRGNRHTETPPGGGQYSSVWIVVYIRYATVILAITRGEMEIKNKTDEFNDDLQPNTVVVENRWKLFNLNSVALNPVCVCTCMT